MSSDSHLTIEQPAFFFDRDQLLPLAHDHAEAYQSADPFPHAVIDDFLPRPVLEALMSAFPSPTEIDWHRFDNSRELKLAMTEQDPLPAYVRQVLAEFNSATMIDFLEALTGMEGLIPDPHFWGGGLHQIEPGGHLDVHSDFNWHSRLLLDRRINLLVYLNDDWQPEWGGALELWNEDMTECRQRVDPIANRCVVFSTTDTSFHGHPEPLACPPGRTRRSLALYYYSNGRPADELSALRTTAFQPRPGEAWRRGTGQVGVIRRAARAARRRLTS
jgi:2OG-Fe(II) oxygenase superfamily